MIRAGRRWLGVAAVKFSLAVLTAIALVASLICTSTYAWIARCVR